MIRINFVIRNFVPLPSYFFSPESGLERQVKEILHKAFWEILRTELESDPPQFKQVRSSPGQCCGSMTFWCGSVSGSGSADPCL
jgi:hypothetical protein